MLVQQSLSLTCWSRTTTYDTCVFLSLSLTVRSRRQIRFDKMAMAPDVLAGYLPLFLEAEHSPVILVKVKPLQGTRYNRVGQAPS
jgi:hypothetical protein